MEKQRWFWIMRCLALLKQCWLAVSVFDLYSVCLFGAGDWTQVVPYLSAIAPGLPLGFIWRLRGVRTIYWEIGLERNAGISKVEKQYKRLITFSIFNSILRQKNCFQ
jgi:hypothetical protein